MTKPEINRENKTRITKYVTNLIQEKKVRSVLPGRASTAPRETPVRNSSSQAGVLG